MKTLQESVALDTPEKLDEHVKTIREEIAEDRKKREELAYEGLLVNEAKFEFDGDEILCECDVMGLTLVVRMDASAEWERGDRDCGKKPHWETSVGEIKEAFIDFGRGNVVKEIPKDCGLSNAIAKRADNWMEGEFEAKGAPEKEAQDD